MFKDQLLFLSGATLRHRRRALNGELLTLLPSQTHQKASPILSATATCTKAIANNTNGGPLRPTPLVFSALPPLVFCPDHEIPHTPQIVGSLPLLPWIFPRPVHPPLWITRLRNLFLSNRRRGFWSAVVGALEAYCTFQCKPNTPTRKQKLKFYSADLPPDNRGRILCCETKTKKQNVKKLLFLLRKFCRDRGAPRES